MKLASATASASPRSTRAPTGNEFGHGFRLRSAYAEPLQSWQEADGLTGEPAFTTYHSNCKATVDYICKCRRREFPSTCKDYQSRTTIAG